MYDAAIEFLLLIASVAAAFETGAWAARKLREEPETDQEWWDRQI